MVPVFIEVNSMNAFFIWKGETSTDYGVYLQEIPPRVIPEERFTNVTIPGRPGSLTVTEGEDVFDDIVISCECFIENEENISEICAWLRGSGTLTFGNRDDGHYEARIANQISFEQVVRGNPYRRFTVNFRCSPFFYLDGVRDITVTSSGTFIRNLGNIYSEPKITVYGSGEINLSVGSSSVITLSNVTDHIILDCALKEAYKGTALLNNVMTGNFPKLVPGNNAVIWTGNVSRIVIEPRWREI